MAKHALYCVVDYCLGTAFVTLQVCLGDEKGALCRRCCVVPGLTHPEATAATGQKKMSHCLTRPVELVWQRHALYCVVDYCLGSAFVKLQVCLGDEKGALCRRCCVVPGLTHPEATAATGQKKMSHCLTRPVELVWQKHALYCVVDYCLGSAFVTLQVCLGDEKGALRRRCCVVPGLTHPEATAATGQKTMSHCLTRPVELVWQRHALYCVVDYSLGTAFVTLQVCLGDEKGALCRRCCEEFGLEAACVTRHCSWDGTCQSPQTCFGLF